MKLKHRLPKVERRVDSSALMPSLRVNVGPDTVNKPVDWTPKQHAGPEGQQDPTVRQWSGRRHKIDSHSPVKRFTPDSERRNTVASTNRAHIRASGKPSPIFTALENVRRKARKDNLLQPDSQSRKALFSEFDPWSGGGDASTISPMRGQRPQTPVSAPNQAASHCLIEGQPGEVGDHCCLQLTNQRFRSGVPRKSPVMSMCGTLPHWSAYVSMLWIVVG